MKIYTVHVPATFAFDVQADSEAEAVRIARETLHSYEPVDDNGGLSLHFTAPWVAVAGHDEDFPGLEVVDVFEDEL